MIPQEKLEEEEGKPPILKSWKNIYALVFTNLIFWLTVFFIFRWIFE